jgi:hypothetical protein
MRKAVSIMPDRSITRLKNTLTPIWLRLITLGHDLLECYQGLDCLNPHPYASRGPISRHA